MKDKVKYKSVKLEETVYAKLQYLKKKHKHASLSETIDKHIEVK